ncbi:MAG TPA: nucleoside diphosphate kinase regulator [Kiloniellales bacterium]|jgi:regulator of nucleoside diphosphate kinase|nr:nucleoside diphosphate kinase regulator [Kiloniellales bacterium]
MSVSSVDTALPTVVIDEAYYDRLESLAMGGMERAQAAAERLLEELERAEVLPSEEVPQNVVNIGSEVTYSDDEGDRSHTVCLVFPAEADISQNRISVLTPVGAALIGLSEGQSITWLSRDGKERRLTVLEVKPPEK